MTNKFFNKRCSYDNQSFASQGERDCFKMLMLMEKAGEIDFIQAQCKVVLIDEPDARISYIADFKIFDRKIEEFVWIEYKGFETDVWVMKRKLWVIFGPGKLRIYKGYGLKVTLTKEIPKGRWSERISSTQDA